MCIFYGFQVSPKLCSAVCFQRQDESTKPDSVLESTVDAAEWKLEVERVLPMLKVHIRSDNKVRCLECD